MVDNSDLSLHFSKIRTTYVSSAELERTTEGTALDNRWP